MTDSEHIKRLHRQIEILNSDAEDAKKVLEILILTNYLFRGDLERIQELVEIPRGYVDQ